MIGLVMGVAFGVLVLAVATTEVKRMRRLLDAAELREATLKGSVHGLELRLAEQQAWIDRLERDLHAANLRSLGRNMSLLFRN